MNDAIRKKAASILAKPVDQISEADVELALDKYAESDSVNALNDAKEKLAAHVDRGAVSQAAFDAAVADITKGSDASKRRALTNKWHDTWSVLDDGVIPVDLKGSDKQLKEKDEDPNASVATSVGDRVAELRKANPSMTPLEAHQQVTDSLTDEERAQYEEESTDVASWLRGD